MLCLHGPRLGLTPELHLDLASGVLESFSRPSTSTFLTDSDQLHFRIQNNRQVRGNPRSQLKAAAAAVDAMARRVAAEAARESQKVCIKLETNQSQFTSNFLWMNLVACHSVRKRPTMFTLLPKAPESCFDVLDVTHSSIMKRLCKAFCLRLMIFY